MGNRFPRVQVETFPQAWPHPTLAFLHDYWQGKRGARKLPSRRDIVPLELKEYLGWVVLIDVMPGMTDFKYRLIGTLVTQYFRTDSTGLTPAEAWAPQGRDAVHDIYKLLRAVAGKQLVLRLHGDADWYADGREPFDSLYLPLSDDGENVDRILHAFVFDKPDVLMARAIARVTGELPARPRGM